MSSTTSSDLQDHHQLSPQSSSQATMKDDEDEVDPQVEFCSLSSRSLQRPSDHYIPPPRRPHIASRLLRDPWTTALTQFSKVTNYVLNPYEDYEGPSLFDLRNTLRDPLGYAKNREEGAHYGNKRDSNPEPVSHPPPALPSIDCSVPQQRLPPLTYDEYTEKYANASRKELLDRVFKGGIASHSLRRQLWPIVLGITDKNDNLDWSQLKTLYNYYSNQWKAILPDQESRFTAYRERKSLIDRDVVRCDRTHSFFAESTGNVEKLRQLLMTYIMYDFDTGYVQGMTDLAAPLLYVWNGEIPQAFWCFVQIMNLFKRNFEMSQKAISNQLKALIKLVRITDPVFAQYLRNNESENCYFAFRWIICLFKREFMKRKTDDYDDCLIVWETIWSIHSLASYDEDKQEKYLDQSLLPILEQIENLKRFNWDEQVIFKSSTSSTESSVQSLSATVGTVGVAVNMKRSSDSSINGSELIGERSDFGGEEKGFDDLDRPRQRRRQLKSPPPPPPPSSSTTSVQQSGDDLNTSAPLSPPSKTKSIQISAPPKPRPVMSSSPSTRTPSNVVSYAISPPVRDMYLNYTADGNSDFIVCSPGSVGSKSSKGSNEEMKRLVTTNANSPGSSSTSNLSNTPTNSRQEGNYLTSKPLDSSDELKSYEFDQLTGDSSSLNRQAKLENFELFCLCICLAIMRRERDIILINKYEASEILKHFNTLQLNEFLDSILLHAMTIWHWLKHDGGEKSLYSDDDKPGNTSVDDFDLLNDDDIIDCQTFAALNV